jgi:hypothetical protein
VRLSLGVNDRHLIAWIESRRVLVLGTAVLVIAGHVLLTAWRLTQVWWWQDDLAILGRAAAAPVSGLVWQNYNGHLVPATWLMARVVDAVSPFGWDWAVVVVTALTAAIDLALLAVLVRLFGVTGVVLVPLVLYTSAASVLAATLWWAAAMQWLPTTLSLLLALWFHLGLTERGWARDAVGALLAVAGGLLCYEKAVLNVGVLALFTLLYGTAGRWWRRPWRALRRRPWYWLSHLLLAGGYAALYLSRAHGVTQPARSVRQAADLTRTVLLDALVPSLLGGPIRWYGPQSALPASPLWFRIGAWSVASLVVGGSVLAWRGAWRAWLLLGSFVAVTIVLLAVTRVGAFGPAIGLDGRYTTDALALAAICATLAWVPLRPGLDPSGGARTGVVPVSIYQPQPADRSGRRLLPVPSPWLNTLGVVTCLAVFTAGLVSGQRYLDNWKHNPTRPYLEHLQVALAAEPGVVLFDQQLPNAVMLGIFGDDSRLSTVTRPMPHRPTLRDWQSRLRVVDDGGNLREGRVFGTSIPAPTGGHCTGRGRETTVPLGGAASSGGDWTFRIGYVANRASAATVTIGASRVPLRLEPGLHEVFVRAPGGGDVLGVSDLVAGAAVCVGEVVAGLATA